MATRGAKSVLSRMKLTYEAVGVVVTNHGQGLIKIDDLSQLNEKYGRVSFGYHEGLEGPQGVCPILGL